MEAAPIPKLADEPDMAFVKEMIDIIKNKLLFFMPFFGAFLAFLLTRHEYVSSAGIVIQVVCFACFVAGLNYAYQVVQAFWILDQIRLVYAIDKSTSGAMFVAMKQDERDALKAVLDKLAPIHSIEDKLFRRTMSMIYWTGALVLWDIYFGKYFLEISKKLLSWAFPLI